MKKLTVADLWKLEDYAEARPAFRAKVIAHKKNRILHLGPNVTLLFEDRMLVQYQVQEMLRIERIFDKAAIQEELAAYNPLIPDGRNWKATCLIEFEDVHERRKALQQLKGIERQIRVRIGDRPPVTAVADEDLERANEEKTSAVHFLRFELPDGDAQALKSGAGIEFEVAHPAYSHRQAATGATRAALLADLD